ncbi:MAG: filamentous hemagglutinin N-terminal domain-containing protein [Desulfobacter postgatei]|uniref:two-partner secretion domain-containing protein n=1 Tax=Desulfobacter postgatei TaxID=2293 RepID=UPI0023F0F103|nr:filamentous hemagglutinin N-terminal domain-containing protein [Desulfobacter postgatei]MDD4273547.1 filamentous hemagglutinin N-terminal domain-containing protein [Desulfobacter postgatei]
MIENRSLHCIFILFTALFLHASLASLGHAEITLDGTVGPCYQLSGPDFMIPAEAGRQVGGNLFHSFGLFNVNTGESATFTGPDSVENILGRVTGGSSSTINGLLRSEIPGADLFLINPAGIMFGANAQLDVQGSFHVSTADFVSLGEHGRFDAVEPDTSVLTVAPPSAFGFLGENPAFISVQGSTLNIPARETLSIVGGDILIEGGFLSAMGGKINLASVASAGELNIENITHNVFEQLGNINLTKSSHLLTTGLRGGDIYICSNRFVVDNSNLWAYTLGEGNGGAITIDAVTLSLTNGAYIASKSWGTGNGGNITLTVSETIAVSGNSGVSVSTYISGNGGDILITTPYLSIDNSWIDGETLNEGKGGEITINVDSLTLTNQASIGSKSWGAGNAGKVTLTACDAISVSEYSGINVSTFRWTSGKGGNILITTPYLSIDKSWIDGDTLGQGKGGDITINVDSLTLTNQASIGAKAEDAGSAGMITITADDAIRFFGSSRVSVSTQGRGNGGDLSITAPNLSLDDSWINGETDGEGKGGNISIDVGSLSLTNGADIFSNAWGIGNGGTINLTASDAITISGQESEISVITYRSGEAGSISISTPNLGLDGSWIWGSTAGKGEGGKIKIDAGSLRLTNGAHIESNALGVGNAGEITMTACDAITISGNSLISTSTVGSGIGGSLLITVPALELNNSWIKGETLGKGKGGNIQLQTKKIVLDNGSAISAESSSTGWNIDKNSEVAKSGNIAIQFDDTLQINNGSRISVQTKEANAGDIKINEKVKEGFLVHLRDKGAITTSVAGGKGNGGNILIDPVFVVLDGASEIVANAIEGGGGDIDIHIVGDGAFLKSPDSIIDASSKFGVSGSVRIDAPDTDISGSISTLPASFLDASSLLSERCVTRTAGELSTFNIVGHGGMPLCPDTLWPAFYLLDNPKDQQKNPELNNK